MTEKSTLPYDPLAVKFGMTQEKWAIIKQIVMNIDSPLRANNQNITDTRPFQKKITDFIPKE